MDTRSITYSSILFFCLALLCCKQELANTKAKALEDAKPLLIQTDSVPASSAVIMPAKPTSIDYDTTLWTDLEQLDPMLVMDIRYATTNNFVEEQLYDCPRCFLRPEAAVALGKVHEQLISKGYSLKLFDCYRPKFVQERLWQKVPNASYVTPPHKGSMHNRGYAVDVTLLDENGLELDMGTGFDFFGRKAHHDFYDLEEAILTRRILLRETMAEFGFKHIRTEWWHYSYQGPYQSPFEVADYQWSCH